MKNIDLNILLFKKIEKLYLILWPPYEEINNLDISIGLIIYGEEEMFVLTTDTEDNWTPVLTRESLPDKSFVFEQFTSRITKWQKCEIDDMIDKEYYDFTNSNLFKGIVEQIILDIELLSIEGKEIFGVKLIFENDYILSTPISDGNTIETKMFNHNDNLKYYLSLGKIKFSSVKILRGY